MTDTNILIDASRNVPQAVAFVNAQRTAGGVCISVITAMELVAGCRDANDLARLRSVMRRFSIWQISTAVSRHAHQLMGSFHLSHGLSIPDALIAATALGRSATLYTLNTRHFQMIPGLTVTRPY